TGTVSSIIAGSGTGAVSKGGTGTLILSGANQFAAAVNVNQGVLNIRNSSALGSPAAGTTVNLGSQLQIQGGITVLAEPLTATGMGPSNTTYGVAGSTDGAIYVAGGNNTWSGTVALAGVTTNDAPALFPNGGFTTFTGSGIGVAGGASLNVSNVLSGG